MKNLWKTGTPNNENECLIWYKNDYAFGYYVWGNRAWVVNDEWVAEDEVEFYIELVKPNKGSL